MNKRYLIKGGTVIDPLNKINGVFDIIVSAGKIEKAGKDLSIKAGETIEAKGKIVAPGLIDMHVHLREPGREDEETVKSGSRAAVHGGFTGILCMPNTDPAIDKPEIVKTLKEIIASDAACSIFIAGAATLGRAGDKLTDFDKLKKEGVVAVSDDGSPVQDKGVMEEALESAKRSGLLLIEHCEDLNLAAGGVMNKGFVSTKAGLKGISARSEYDAVKRNLEIAKKTNSRIHIAHVSCKESVELIRKAKKDGVGVTAETAPHYFTLTEDCCVSYDTNTKMNPPLRTKEDVEAVKAGLADGTIDAIASDHAPHTDAEKDVEFDYAPFGIIGLETALSLGVTELIEKKVLSWNELILKLSANPAAILGLAGGSLKEGSPADITIIDPMKEFVFKKDSIESKSKNSPFLDWRLKGKAVTVFVNGKIIMKDEMIL
ncbi:MAG: dihydroorotase [Candidatus Omnitrophica bacterium]|nr:dihydroorotase [Candidatus Omnitrophota bacterium]MDD5436564.1 dihydroorotase [Candidatus Omnitrophota bacterium]